LNDKAIGCTELGKTQRMIALLRAVLKMTSYKSLNIFPANKVAILCSVDLLYYFYETVLLNYSRDREPQILSSTAAGRSALVQETRGHQMSIRPVITWLDSLE
jgi:hypothetical protein